LHLGNVFEASTPPIYLTVNFRSIFVIIDKTG